MSVELVKEAMHKFLTDPRPQVLCVSGRWGTGKTHAWNQAVKLAAAETLPMSKYAYVSLFGIKDAADILQIAYVNTVELKLSKLAKLDQQLSATVGVSLGDLTRNAKKLANALASHASIPWVSGLGGVARAVMSNLIKSAIVCIDDIERKGHHVTITEIMGAVAELRDTRSCKVVLILNENNLEKVDREQFALYSEKVIDMTFKFEPTATEAAAIAFPNTDELSERLRQASTELGITNIRVLIKIGDHARNLTSLLKDIDPHVSAGVLRSLVVIAWSILSPGDEGAPKLEYLLDRRHDQHFGAKKQEFTDAETAWGALLDLYGFTSADEFDRTLVEDLQRGFFDWGRLKVHIEKYLTDARKARAHNALEAAWRLARSSYDDNADQVGPAIYEASTAHIEYLSATMLSNTVSLLKGVGFPDLAKDLIDRFMVAHADLDIFDWRNGAFGGSVDDPDVIVAFDAKQATKHKVPLSPLAAATRIHSGAWSNADEDALRRLSVDEFEALFKAASESDRYTLVHAALSFFKISNARPDQREISERAKAALIRIGNSSPMNRFRVRALGIQIDDPSDDTVHASEG